MKLETWTVENMKKCIEIADKTLLICEQHGLVFFQPEDLIKLAMLRDGSFEVLFQEVGSHDEEVLFRYYEESGDLKDFKENFVGVYSDIEEFGMYQIDKRGEEVPEWLAEHIDHQSYGNKELLKYTVRDLTSGDFVVFL